MILWGLWEKAAQLLSLFGQIFQVTICSHLFCFFTCTWVQAYMNKKRVITTIEQNCWIYAFIMNCIIDLCYNKNRTCIYLWGEVVKMLLLSQPRPPSRLPVGLLPALPPPLHLGLEVQVILRPGAPGPQTRSRRGPTWHGHVSPPLVYSQLFQLLCVTYTYPFVTILIISYRENLVNCKITTNYRDATEKT